MQKKQRFSQRERRLRFTGEAVQELLDAWGGKERRHLIALWRHWDMVMGEAITALGIPLGNKDDCLILGADDSMALQELSLQSFEILERANAFMDSLFFRKVRVTLPQGKPNLSKLRPLQAVDSTPQQLPPRPPDLGALVGKLDPESPVTRCYEVYVRIWQEKSAVGR